MEISEASYSEVQNARQIVFLADVQQELQQTQRVFWLTLRMDVSSEGMNQNRVVHAEDRMGNPVTGENGQYVHPRNDNPKSVAAELARLARKAQKQQQDAR